jgi:spore coat polysaccharide biosynthesis protein SpsF
MMKCVILVQARMNSSRLPGKVLKPIGGKPLLAYVLERLQRVENADGLLVATSTLAADDDIAAFCNDFGVDYYRGSETDVLDRYYQAARSVQAERIVRITSDCPLIDADVVSEIIDAFDAAQGAGIASGLNQQTPNEARSTEPTRIDYLSNTLDRTFPRGLDVEVFSFEALEIAWKEAQDTTEREHVTPFLYRHPDRFRLQQYRQAINRSHLRWTVDTPEDFELVALILGELTCHTQEFGQAAILRLLDKHPNWSAINAHIEQKPLEMKEASLSKAQNTNLPFGKVLGQGAGR